MKFSAIAATLAALLPVALADGNRPFQLRVPQDGPAEIAGQFVTKNTDVPISPYLGFGVGGEPFTAIIKDESNPTHGEVVDAEDANAPLWLRPTHGTPFYFVRYGGNPLDDAVPALVLYKDWSIETVAPPNVKARRSDRYILKYGDENWQSKMWTACGSGDGKWYLYYNGRRDGCTESFDMEVVYN